ncbi:amino acid adenylation domain-containing protein [Sorangium sp. So ce136]|uniref:amino acid adenylation domain-containing protein n=1 Tax=Sorangium sp. So ce136 TaxID=3133284 RepID=UPI003F01F1F2
MGDRDEGREARPGDVAIIGMAGRFPGAPDVERFWDNLRAGVESIARFAPEELEDAPFAPAALRARPEFVPARGVLGDGDRFDHAFFDVTPADARRMDPQLRLFLECAWGALENAGYDPRPYPGKIALYAGAGLSSHLLSLLDPAGGDPAALFEAVGTGSAEGMAMRVAHELGLRGESLSIYTACSTSLVAVHMACQSLLLRQSDMALAGGVSLSLPERTGYLYQDGMILSPDGHCRAFDERARGTVGGHGAGVVVLKLLDDALRDGDHVYAVIRGSAINNDGGDKVGYTAPSVAGQAEVIRQALSYADVEPDTIGYVEAHGTATQLGDPMEIAAITRAYRERTDRRGYCALGSVKTNIGHLDVAAGVAGLIKAGLALERGEIPPSLHFERPNPKLDLAASPFFVSARLTPFPRSGAPRRAAVSSFGVGGTNAHAVLEEAPPLSSGPTRRPAFLIPLSARTPAALEAMTTALAAHLERHPEQALADVAYTLAVGRRAFAWRRALVARDRDELCRRLRDRPPAPVEAGVRGRGAASPGEAPRRRPSEEAPRVALLFPGQGAQAVGMGEALYRAEPLFRGRIHDASEALRPALGLPLEMVIAPPADRREEAERALARPEVALPALVAVELALAALWASWGVRAHASLGHSLGEYAAACLAGVMRFEDVLRVAHERGRLVARTAPGRMLAVALPHEELSPLLQGEVALAAVNARARSVVSGPKAAVEALAEALARRKVATAWLPVGHAFHSPSVEPILGELEEVLGRISLRPPAERYVSSRTGTWIRPEEATDPAYWAAQMREPVRFAAGLDTLLADGCRLLVEVGPDQALCALSRAHLGAQIRALPSLPKAASGSEAHAVILGSLGALWAEGAEPELRALSGDEARRRVPLPSYPFAGPRFPAAATLPRLAAVTPAGADPRAAHGAPGSPEAAAATGAASRESGTEARIAALWRDLLGIAEVSAGDNFLEIGGNSLVAAQALARLRDLFPVELSLGDLFEALTLGELAALIDDRLGAAGAAASAPGAPAAPRPVALPIEALGPRAPRPLSYVQERVLQLDALEPGSPALHMHVGVRLAGELDVPRLREALGATVARHEALRTVYRRDAAGAWAPIVLERQAAPLVVHELTEGAAGERGARAAAIERAEVERPFDLESGPVLRAALVRLGEGERHLLLTLHHVVADTGSLAILLRELGDIYGALARGERPALPPLAIQIGDHAAWQRRAVTEGALVGQLAFWRERLARLPSLPIATDRAPAGREGLRSEGVRIAWPPALARAVRELGHRQGATPFATLLAAYALLLGRHANEDEVVVGTPIGNRSRPELSPLVGYVAHSVALRVGLGGEPSFAALVRRARDAALDAQANGEAPFEALAPELGRTRDPSKTRLFDAVIVFHAASGEQAAPALGGAPIHVEGAASFGATLGNLSLNLSEGEAGFTGELRYNPELFDEATARRLVDRMAALLEAALAAPETPIGALPLASEQDRAELATAARRLTLPDEPIAPALRRLPESAAIVEGGVTLTADALWQRAERVARWLLASGLARGAVVGLRFASVADTLAALLGTLRAGGTAAVIGAGAPGRASAAALVLDEDGLGRALAGSPGAAALGPLPSPDEPAVIVRPRGTRQELVFDHQSLAAYGARLDALLGVEAGVWLAAGERGLDRFWLELLWALGRGFRVVVPRADRGGALLGLRGAPAEPPRPLDLSLFYFAADEGAAGARKYRLLLDGARRADQLGFAAIWTPERHFHPFGGMYPNPALTSAALATVTERIGLRAGSVVLPLHHPARVAEEWSVVDNLSGGRVGIAFASGWHVRDFVFAPGQYARRKELLKEGLTRVRRLWRGEELRLEDGAGGEVAVRVYPRPVQRELPVWLTSGGSPETFRLAGELGARLLTNLMGQRLSELADKIAAYREAWEEHGHGPGRGHVTLMMHAFVGPDLDTVRRTARDPLLAYLRGSLDAMEGFAATAGLDAGALSPRDVEKLLERGFDRYFHAAGLFGTPASCRDMVEHVRRIDVDEVACLIDFGIAAETVIDGFDGLAALLREVNQGAAPPARQQDEGVVWEEASDSVAALIEREGVTHVQASASLARALRETRSAALARGGVLVQDGASRADGAALEAEAEAAWAAGRANPALAVEPAAWRGADAPWLVALDRYGEPLPWGIPGELAVVGAEVPRGYAGVADERGDFIAAPGAALGARRYRTGRLGRRRRDGGLEVLGALPSAWRAAAPATPPAEVLRRSPPPIRRLERRQDVPLSYAQQRLWLLDQLAPGNPAYNNAVPLALSGPLDVAALVRSIQEIVARHEVLRTAFVADAAGQPVQHILDASALALEVPLVAIAGDEAAQRAEVARRLTALAREPFDLAAPPLLRAVLFRLGDRAHVLALVMHHIISDGWSGGVFTNELSALYRAFRAGEPSPLPALPLQYADYSAWQRAWLGGEARKAEVDHWKKALSGVPLVLDMPTDRPRRPRMMLRGARQPVLVPRPLVNRISALARASGVTPFMALVAIFGALLHRYSGQERLALGSPVAGRSRPEVEGLLGCFVNTLVIGVDLRGAPSLRELLGRVRRTALDAFEHAELPFEELVDALAPERDLSRTPVIQAMLVLQNTPEPLLQPDGLELGALPVETGTAKLELSLELTEMPEGLSGALEYATDLYTADTASRMVARLLRLLDAALGSPDLPLRDLPLLEEAERASLAAWNDTAADYPADRCVHELFEAQVARAPGAVAVQFQGAQLTYAELDAGTNRLAHHLRALGVGPEVRVGLCVERSLAMVVGLLAILKAGGAYVPLDPSYPPERLAFMLADADVPVLLTHAPVEGRLPAHSAMVVRLEADAPVWSACPSAPPATGVLPSHLAYVLYTSGSTGRPKGVQITHQAVTNLLDAFALELDVSGADTLLAVTSMSFDIAALELFLPLVRGARVHVAAERETRNGEALREAAAGATLLQATPTTWRLLVEAGWQGRPGLRALCGGEALQPGLAAELTRRAESVWNVYGPTETTIWSALWRVPSDVEDVRLGRGLANTQLHILDAHLAPVPVGVPGELYIAGAGLSRGYLGRPALTAERFLPDPFSSLAGARMYRTGDLARWTGEGEIEFLGRVDHQIKIRGFRVELGEIERVLLQHPGVRDCAVVLREDAPAGEEPGATARSAGAPTDQRIVAYVVPGEGEPGPSALREHLAARLPEYMVPSSFVRIEALPLSPNGKVDRKALPAPERGQKDAGQSHVAARTPTERALVDAWQALLGVAPIGVTDDFFSLGGHSLLAVRLMAAVKARLGWAPPMASLFQRPTIEALAAQVDGTAERAEPGAQLRLMRRAAAEAPYSGLTGNERRLWFLERLSPEARSYQVPHALLIRGEFSEAALRESLIALARRHEVLRTSYPEVDGAPVRVVSEEAAVPVRVEDVSALPLSGRQAAVRALVAAEVGAAFDLTHGPLTRVLVVRQADDEHLVVVHQHHIVTDEWSGGVLLREVSALYGASGRGGEAALPELPYQVADYARAEQEALDGQGFAASRAYWRAQLAGVPRLELSIARATGQPGPEGTLSLRLSDPTSRGLVALARAAGGTRFMVWYAALSALLSRYSHQTDFGLGAVVANREVEGTEGPLGFFTNTVVLRTDLSGDPPFRELLRRARITAVDAYRHQSLPFDLVVQDQGVARRAGENPLYDVSLLEMTAPETADLPGWSPVSPPVPDGVTSAKDALSVAVWHGREGTELHVSYDTARVERAAVERLIGHLQALLSDAVAHPDRRLSELSLLTEAETAALAAWNDTAADYPADRCVHELFEAQVARTPERVAVELDGEQLSYRELNERANRLAHRLRGLGVGPDARVAICLERSLEMVAAIVATLKAGGAYVPLDPAYPDERIAQMLRDSAPAAVLTQTSLRARLATPASIVVIDAPESTWQDGAAGDLDPDEVGLRPEHLAYVIYTSGSTGVPKGVAMPHGALVNLLAWQRASLPEPARTLQFAALGFDVAFQEIFSTLTSGGTLVLIREALRQDLPALAERLGGAAIERLFLPYIALNALSELWSRRGEPLPELREVITAGEQLRITPAIRRMFAQHPRARLHNHYGPTESHVVTAHLVDGPPAAWEDLPPIGRPIGNCRIYLLDAQRAPVPVGVAGELWIGGAQVARGYLHRPELTAERFVDDPFVGGRMYRTGDLARWREDGSIEYLGRDDLQVKIRGYRVELGEIEAQLSRVPGVREAAVIAREDVPGDKRLVAYLVADREASPSSRLDAAPLREHLAARLPEYMVPSSFVRLEALPLSPNGKVDRKALPAPERAQKDAGRSHVAPRTPTERALVDAWQALLGVAPIGVTDDFFSLGGHSLLAVRLMTTVQARLGWAPPMASLFQRPTIEALAAQVDGTDERPPRAAELRPRPRAAGEPAYSGLTGNERLLWSLKRLWPEAWSNELVDVSLVRGEFSEAALRESLVALARRHEVLRTSYPEVDGAPVRVVSEEAAVPVRVEDVSALPLPERQAAVGALIAAEAETAFDLAQCPLIRVLVIRQAAQEHFVVVNQHHIVTDGWSLGLFRRELSALYEASRRGEEAALPELPYQVADYARAEQGALDGGGFAASRAYWKAQLAGTPPLALPIVRATAEPGMEGYLSSSLSEETSRRLFAFSRASGVTRFQVWYAALSALLSRYSHQTDFALGNVVANREEAGTEPLLGFFATPVVLRIHLSGDPPFREILQRARATAVEAYRHQALPFEVVMQDQGLVYGASENPLYDVSLFEVVATEEDAARGWSLIPTRRPAGAGPARNALSVSVSYSREGTHVSVSYDMARVERAAVERLIDHLQALLSDAIAHPDKRLSELSLSAEAQSTMPST